MSRATLDRGKTGRREKGVAGMEEKKRDPLPSLYWKHKKKPRTIMHRR